MNDLIIVTPIEKTGGTSFLGSGSVSVEFVIASPDASFHPTASVRPNASCDATANSTDTEPLLVFTYDGETQFSGRLHNIFGTSIELFQLDKLSDKIISN